MFYVQYLKDIYVFRPSGIRLDNSLDKNKIYALM